jgi:hypothetical protein
LCKKGNADQALQQLRKIMSKLKLTVNEEKTRICRVPEGEFDFLGYTFGRMFSERTGQARLGYRPSKKSIKRMVEKIHALTDRTGTWQVKRLPNVATEMALNVLSYNLTRVLNIVGVKPLLAAMRA